jgi:hypothetical protein
MRVKGIPVRIGDIARSFAACHPVTINGVSTSPVLLRGYLETAEQCVRVNGCMLCRRELERLAAAMGTTCAACGRERFRQLCREVGPCP